MGAEEEILVQIRRPFDQSSDAVYAAWTDREIVRRWLFVSPTNEILDVRIEPHAGGLFCVDELSHRQCIEHWGRFTKVEPPHRLAFTLNVPKHFHGEAQIDIEIEDEGQGCRLTFTQTRAAPVKAEETWRGMLDALARMLRGQPAYDENTDEGNIT